MADNADFGRRWIDLPVKVRCDPAVPAFELALEPLGDTLEIRPGQSVSLRLVGHLVGELIITRDSGYLELWANGVDVLSVQRTDY